MIQRRSRLLFWNSAVALVLAGMLSITLHELSHFLTGLALGRESTLYATSVAAGNETTSVALATAAAGPLFSIVFGLIIVFTGRHWGRGFVRLFWMWLGFTSAQVGFGYLMIAIIAPVGDTGKVLALLDASGIVYWASLVVGIIGTLWLSRLFATQVVSYSGGSEDAMRDVGIFSWLLGTGILVLVYLTMILTLPADAIFVSIMGIVAIAIFAPMFSFFYKRVEVQHEQLELKTPLFGIVFAVIVALTLVFVISQGITVG